MSFAIGRHDLVALAEAKLLDAALLLGHERFGNAYYLAGYAVEIGLKAAISRQFAADTLPDPKFVRTLYTHSVKELVSAAGLVPALKARQDESPTFSSHWTVVLAWTEEARYRSVDATTARMMVEAVSSDPEGVLPWLRMHW